MIEIQLSFFGKALPIPEIENAIRAFTAEIADTILKEALANLEKGGQWVTGRLAKSGKVDLSDLKFYEALVIFSAPYAPFVEYGTRPHVAPLGPSLAHKKVRKKGGGFRIKITSTPNPSSNPLDYWAWRLGKREAIQHKKYGVHTSLGFGVWKKIIAVGTDPHPYLRPAYDSVKARVKSIAKKHGLEFE